eukprot:12400092-Karenia_brevis.AAC.1
MWRFSRQAYPVPGDRKWRSMPRCAALSRDGSTHAHADWCDGAVLEQAVRDEAWQYPELAVGRRCGLAFVGVEAGGRI